MHPSQTQPLQFGVFEADLSVEELRKNGRVVRLQQQPFRLLALLLANAGEIVTREQIQATLWPGNTFVEFEHGVNTAVKKVRQVLGDSAESPRYVETIPRKGYRFVCPVAPVRPPGIPEIPQADRPLMPHAAPIVSRRRRLRVLGVTALIGTSLVLLVATIFMASHDANPRVKAPPVPVPLTAYPGNEFFPTFSPDGSQLAFYWDGPKPGSEGIYVKVIGTEPPVLVARTKHGHPKWSPDGRLIAFVAPVAGSRCGLFVVPPTGGAVREVAELAQREERGLGVLSWHPSGEWLAVVDTPSLGKPSALFWVSVSSGEKRRLTSPTGIVGDFAPAVSPDGNAVVFSRAETYAGRYLEILEIGRDLDPRDQPRRLTFSPQMVGAPVWMPDGHSIVFMGGQDHDQLLFRLNVLKDGRPGSIEQLTFAGEAVAYPAVSSKGRLAYTKNQPANTDIWRLDLTTCHESQCRPERLISSTRIDHVPAYSPDGRRIAFASMRSGSYEIWVCDSDGLNPIQITSLGKPSGGPYTTTPRWSLDARSIYFSSDWQGHEATYSVKAEGGQPTRVNETEASAQTSKDGKWTYFVSRVKGSPQIFRRPARGGLAVQVTTSGVDNFIESPDGKFLYYAAGPSGTDIWRVAVTGGEEIRVIEGANCGSFAVAEHGVYFMRRETPAAVLFLNFRTNSVEQVIKIGSGQAPVCGISVSPDNRQLLYTLEELNAGADLMMVDNFH